jgi:lipoyl(octanoyl) transferase
VLNSIAILEFDRLDYAPASQLQRRLVLERQGGRIGDVLLLLEHSPVITLGRNASRANLLASNEALAARGIALAECDRGGDVTYHGPGQLVGYPIFDLRACPRPAIAALQRPNANAGSLGPVDYVRVLEEILIRVAASFGLAAGRFAGHTGVWTSAPPPRKFAAIGVHISRGVTSHGFALNVAAGLDAFRLIVPCGIREYDVTSLARELGREPAMALVRDEAIRQFGLVFGRQMIRVSSLRQLGLPDESSDAECALIPSC